MSQLLEQGSRIATDESVRAAHRGELHEKMRARGIDPSLPIAPGGPPLGELCDDFRRIAVLEAAPVPAIQWMKRSALKLGLTQEVQDNLWRAYERQSRDETDHGAYWGELFFLLTGDEYSAKPWDADGEGGSNVQIEVPPDCDDAETNRRLVFLGGAFQLGLESGFAEHSYPRLLAMMAGSELPITRSFVPLLRTIARDEARHLNIGRYVFHVLRASQGESAEATFRKVVNLGRRAFRVPEVPDHGFAKYIGRGAPPVAQGILGPHVVPLA